MRYLIPTQIVATSNFQKKVKKAKEVFQNHNSIGGIIPPVIYAHLAGCITNILKVFQIQDCPNPKKYPCSKCNACLQKTLGEKLNDNILVGRLLIDYIRFGKLGVILMGQDKGWIKMRHKQDISKGVIDMGW